MKTLPKFAVGLGLLVLATGWILGTATQAAEQTDAAALPPPLELDLPSRLTDYFEQMSQPRPLVVRAGPELKLHQAELRQFVRECTSLSPWPAREPLDVHRSEPLDHPWCTIRRVAYQLWPGAYGSALLYLPKTYRERPAPAVLCPHGHWPNGSAHPEVQKRCLNLARLGYPTLATTQYHYEDLSLGISHQTVMIWNNVRGVDYLQSLPEVDGQRIGAAGASGGGLQTQMLVALDPRIHAATIVGLTCDFRQIMFPAATHCACNHFPRVRQRTDHPEISTLGLPAAVQYLTMNDWTKTFATRNFPAIEQLYAANGYGERVWCRWFDTEHSYDREKREWTYWWLNRWLRNDPAAEPEPEPDTTTIPIDTLSQLTVDVPEDKGLAAVSAAYGAAFRYRLPELTGPDTWRAYRARMRTALDELLGAAARLEPSAEAVIGQASLVGPLLLQRVAYPSEQQLLVPAVLLRPQAATGRLPVTILLSGGGPEALLQETGPGSARNLAASGQLVVLADLRTYGAMRATSVPPPPGQWQAWQRNGIVWGRPIPGMGVTDLLALLDGLEARTDGEFARVRIDVRGSGGLAIAALWAMVLDERIAQADLDFAGACFANGKLPLVPNVLRHGDVIAWAALAADRHLHLRNLPVADVELVWLRQACEAVGSPDAVTTVRNKP